MSSDVSSSSSASTLSSPSLPSQPVLSSTPCDLSRASSSSTSTGVFPMYRGETLSPVDFNLDDQAEETAEESLKSRCGLYDISVEIFVDLPKGEPFNRPDMLRAAVYTICGDFFFKHKEWSSISGLIAYQLGRAVNPTSSTWFPTIDKRLLYRGQARVSGHTGPLAEGVNPPVVYDTIDFSDFICATKVRLEYSVDVFLSPGVTAAETIYLGHGFASHADHGKYTRKHMEDVVASHEEEGLEEFDHHLAWATVYNVLEEYRENVERQSKFFEEYGFSF